MTIVIDTSALAAVAHGAEDAELIVETMLTYGGDSAVSAATLVEALQRPEAVQDLDRLLDDIGARVVPVDENQASLAVDVSRRFDKGRHPAALNFGD
jgi:ribonuclease VapC